MLVSTGALLSLKENMDALKEELSSEEKFFESAIRTERFVKKYQKPLMAAVASLLLVVVGAIAYQAYEDNRSEKSNAALNALLMNPMDQGALKTLKEENSALYELYQLSKAVKENDVATLKTLQGAKSTEVSDIATYESAVLSGDEKTLDGYTKKQGAFYQEMALIELAVLAIQKGDIKSAHDKLAMIKEESTIYPLAQMLSHYGVKE